ncbi:MAG: dihydrodipicolinate synthase family protein [Acidobacteriota bacterium]|nr:dihydrodipicolinate synthase family protein [Blastocatellia bacterium]MDW8413688.1 dihydrodipicolinate synthase family protein [Acidobacteriota bacterium]
MTKKTANLKGVFPAIVTPFYEDGRIDLLGLQSNIAIWNSKGVKGYLVLGSTGEVAHLDRGEKLAVLEAARAAIPPEYPMIVGTGVHSTQATIAFTKRAAEIGASYALVVTPHYFKRDMTDKVLRAYFEAVAEASTIPVLIYNVPQFTGINMSAELIATLARHPNIVGVKDSSGDMKTLIKLLGMVVDKDFAVLTGSALVLYPSLMVGAAGAILAVANFAAEACIEIYELVREEIGLEWEVPAENQQVRIMKAISGKYASRKRAMKLQEQLLVITETVIGCSGIGGIKYAMNCLGYCGGYVREPLVMPDETMKAAIRSVMKATLFPNLVLEE